MTDVSSTHANAALPTTGAAKLIKSNNDAICQATENVTSSTKQVTTVRKISLTNGSTAKINNNTEKISTKTTTATTTVTTDTVNLTTETTNTSKIKMSTVGVKTAPTPTTQSPVTTQPNQAVDACSYNLNLTATSTTTTATTNTNQTNQLIAAKPALQTDRETVTPDTIAIITTHSSASASVSASTSPAPSPTISTGRYYSMPTGAPISPTINSSNPFLKTVYPKQQLREATAQDVDEVARLFEEKPEAFEKWLMERAPPEALARLHEFIESRKQPPKRASVTSDLFQQWMSSSSPIQVSGMICQFSKIGKNTYIHI